MAIEPLCYDGEIWKPVNDPRIEEPLEASDRGRIRRCGHTYMRRGRAGVAPYATTRGPRLALVFYQQGYPYVNIKMDGYTRGIAVHILVCTAFHGPRPAPEIEAAHEDGDRMNPLPGNLSWKTSKQNQADKKRHGTLAEGVKCPLAKMTDDKVRAARKDWDEGAWFVTDLAAKYGVTRATMGKIINGKAWKHVT